MGALIADIDGDGQNELIVALSDRVVRSYRAMLYAGEEMKLVGIHKWEFSGIWLLIKLPEQHSLTEFY